MLWASTRLRDSVGVAFGEILPSVVAVAEARAEVVGVPLYPEEEEVIARAVEKRRREFVTGRACARAALRQLGIAPESIPPGPSGAPRWPTGVVGSITHCEGIRAAAVAPASAAAALGIDAEPHQPLPADVLTAIALPEERAALCDLGRRRPEIHWGRLLFSMKESVYKAWFPLAQRQLGFDDATLTIDLDAGTFSAKLLAPSPSLGRGEPDRLQGRWIVCDGLALTAVVADDCSTLR